MTLNSEQAGTKLQRFLEVLIDKNKASIEITFIPEGIDGSMDYYYKVLFLFKKGIKLDMQFLVSVSGEIYFMVEHGAFSVLDNGGDMTEFWKYLFNSLYKLIKPKV